MMHGLPLWDTRLPRHCAGVQISLPLPRQRNARNLPKVALVRAMPCETLAPVAVRLDEGGVIVSHGVQRAHVVTGGWQG